MVGGFERANIHCISKCFRLKRGHGFVGLGILDGSWRLRWLLLAASLSLFEHSCDCFGQESGKNRMPTHTFSLLTVLQARTHKSSEPILARPWLHHTLGNTAKFTGLTRGASSSPSCFAAPLPTQGRWRGRPPPCSSAAVQSWRYNVLIFS